MKDVNSAVTGLIEDNEAEVTRLEAEVMRLRGMRSSAERVALLLLRKVFFFRMPISERVDDVIQREAENLYFDVSELLNSEEGIEAENLATRLDPGHRLTKAELDAAEKIYNDTRRGRSGDVTTGRTALEAVIRGYLAALAPQAPASPSGSGITAPEKK